MPDAARTLDDRTVTSLVLGATGNVVPNQASAPEPAADQNVGIVGDKEALPSLLR